MNIEAVRIERRGGDQPGDRPFSEVFIRANGRDYYTRLFHTLDNSPFVREEQKQAFLRRLGAAARAS